MLAHDLGDRDGAQWIEVDDRVEPVAELGRERTLNLFRHVSHRQAGRAESDLLALELARADVRGHDEDHVAEVALATVIIRQCSVVHHLKQDVPHVGIRLRSRRAGSRCADAWRGLCKQTRLLESDIPRRCSNEARDRVLFHVLAHVEALKRRAQAMRELF